MPDIAMCRGDGCPVAKYCYRVTAKPSERRQAYFAETPCRYGNDLGCPHFIRNEVPEESAK
jgi:hypothetical protein